MLQKCRNCAYSRYYVDYLASGTGNIIHNGSYFYHRHGSRFLVRYDLNSTQQQQHYLGQISHLDCARKPDHTFEVRSCFCISFRFENNFRIAMKLNETLGSMGNPTIMSIMLRMRMDFGLFTCIEKARTWLSVKLNR